MVLPSFFTKESVLISRDKESNMLALLYNLLMYTQILDLIGGTSRRRVSSYKSEYLYIHKYLYNKILVS